MKITLAAPCQLRVNPGDNPGTACKICGHTSLVHPGFPNPSLDECAICSILDSARRIEEARLPPIMVVPGTSGVNIGKFSFPVEVDPTLAPDEIRLVPNPSVRPHEPAPYASEPPSHNVLWTRCKICDGPLVASQRAPYGLWGGQWKVWVHGDQDDSAAALNLSIRSQMPPDKNDQDGGEPGGGQDQ